MNCPHCASAITKEQTQKTTLGYRMFRCLACKHFFNERTGTPFNFLEYPTDVVLLVVLWRLRYKLSLRDLAEMFLERGWVFTYESVREWERRFAPLLVEQLRRKRRGQAGQSWYVDETYVKVRGVDTVVTRDELRKYLRPRLALGELSSLSERRRVLLGRLTALKASMQAAL